MRWREVSAGAGGYLDLRALDDRPEVVENAIAYAQVLLHSPTAREVPYALGTDDGCQLWVGDELVHEDNTRHGAQPFQHLGTLHLEAGWTPVLIKVENGSGGFGLYFRVLDDAVRSAVRQP